MSRIRFLGENVTDPQDCVIAEKENIDVYFPEYSFYCAVEAVSPANYCYYPAGSVIELIFPGCAIFL